MHEANASDSHRSRGEWDWYQQVRLLSHWPHLILSADSVTPGGQKFTRTTVSRAGIVHDRCCISPSSRLLLLTPRALSSSRLNAGPNAASNPSGCLVSRPWAPSMLTGCPEFSWLRALLFGEQSCLPAAVAVWSLQSLSDLLSFKGRAFLPSETPFFSPALPFASSYAHRS